MKNNSHKRQYRYKIGSVVKLKPELLNDYWTGRELKKRDIGIVTSVSDYSVAIDVYRGDKLIKKGIWVSKGHDVNLLTYEQAIMEKL